MTLDWGSSAHDHARAAQARAGWSDEELLERLLALVRTGASPDLRAARGRIEEAYAALPPGAATSERLELLTRLVPPLHGPWGTVLLADLLRETGRRPGP